MMLSNMLFLIYIILAKNLVLIQGTEMCTENTKSFSKVIMETAKKCNNLQVNEACLNVLNSADEPIQLWTQSVECEQCPLLRQFEVSPGDTKNLTVNTEYQTIYQISNNTNSTFCSKTCIFYDQGIYTLNVTNESCVLKLDNSPENIYYPLLWAFLGYFVIAVLWILGKYLHRKDFFNQLFRRGSTEISTEDINTSYSVSSNSIPQNIPEKKKQRLRSLDTFRGLAIVIMIFVNYGGGNYQFFHHALWNGLTVADLVFPWFIWIMGVSMTLSMCSLLRKSIPRCKIFRKILKRSIILFALGLMLNTFHSSKTDLHSIRISGVLQRFSVSYFVVSTVHLFFAKPQDIYEHTSWAPVRDILGYWTEWLIMLAILTVHILLTFLLDVPGCGRGYLGPGGLHDNMRYENCPGGAAGYIDEIILNKSHLYQHPTFKQLYDPDKSFGLVYDPEGILGYLTSIFLVFLGLQAGKILLTYKEWIPRTVRWISWGILTGAIAAILCKCSQNDGWIPINKNLWSVSYIMAMGSMSFILLSALYIICDVLNWWTGAPFYYPGMNSILLYVGHSITGNMFPWAWKTEESHAAHLGIALWGTSLWVVISIWLFFIKFFLAI